MGEVPTEHLQLQKIREKATDILAKLDNVNIEILRIGRVYVENLRTLRNADFEEWIDDNTLLGWMQTGNISKHTPGVVYGGVCCVEFPAEPCSISQLLELPIKGNFVEKLSIVGFGISSDSKIKFRVEYSDGDNDWHDFALPIAQATECDMTPYVDTSKYLVAVEIQNAPTVPPFPPTYYGCYLDRAILMIPELPRLPVALLAGQQTVAAAGTPVALGSGPISHSILIQSMPTNTGNIIVGNADGQFFVLTPTSEPIRISADDLASIYIDATVNGEGVNYVGG